MAGKYRSTESYLGNTTKARERQRANLISGGGWQKRRMQEMRYDCWWGLISLETIQFIYEACENERDIKDLPKGELKSGEYLNNWWAELDIKDKKFIYKNDMEEYTKGR
ncbi:hypothetical protein ES708_22945 [subsurface metagenome]